MKKNLFLLLIFSAFSISNMALAEGVIGTLNNFNNSLSAANNSINNTQNTLTNIKNSVKPVTDITKTTRNYAMTTKTVEHIKGSGYSKVCENGKCGIQDDFENELISEIKYDSIEKVGETAYFKVKIGNKYAMYNVLAKKEYSDFKYDDIQPIGEDQSNYLKASINGKWSILDLKAVKYLCDYKYDRIDNFHWNGFYKVYIGNKCGVFYLGQGGGGYVMPAGEVVPILFDNVEQTGTKDYFKICQNGLWGIYSTIKKTIVIEPKYNKDDFQYRGSNTFNVKGQIIKL